MSKIVKFLCFLAAVFCFFAACKGADEDEEILAEFRISVIGEKLFADSALARVGRTVTVYSVGGTPTVMQTTNLSGPGKIQLRAIGDASYASELRVFDFFSRHENDSIKKYSFVMPAGEVTVTVSGRQEGDSEDPLLTYLKLSGDSGGATSVLWEDHAPSDDVHGPVAIDFDGPLSAELTYPENAHLFYSTNLPEFTPVPAGGIVPLNAVADGSAGSLYVRGHTESGDEQLYTYIFKNGSAGYEESGDCKLKSVVFFDSDTPLTMTPDFSPSTFSYAINAGMAVEILVVAKRAHSKAQMSMRGDVLRHNTAASILLNSGDNNIAIRVTAEDDTVQTYNFTVTRVANTSVRLNSLAIAAPRGVSSAYNAFVLDNSKTGNEITYSLAAPAYEPIPASDPKVKLTPALSDINAKIFIKAPGLPLAETGSGETREIYLPSDGENIVEYEIRNFAGVLAVKYIIKFYRSGAESASANVTLTGISLSYTGAASVVPFTTAWDGGDVYDLSAEIVPNNIGSVSVNVTPNVPGAKVRIGDVEDIPDGNAAGVLLTGYGEDLNGIYITVTDGNEAKTYTVFVKRAPRSDAALKSLSVRDNVLDAAFASGTENYTMTVSTDSRNVNVSFELNDAGAGAVWSVGEWDSGASSVVVPIFGSGASNTTNFSITVTAQDKVTEKTYTLVITRLPADNNKLRAIKVDGQSFAGFSPQQNDYSYNGGQSVSAARRSVSIIAEPEDSRAVIKMAVMPDAGSPSAQDYTEVNNRVAYSWTLRKTANTPNVIKISVSASNGTVRDYALTIYREYNPASETGIKSIRTAVLSGNNFVYDTYTRVYPLASKLVSEYTLYTTGTAQEVYYSVITTDEAARWSSGNNPYNLSAVTLNSGEWAKTLLPVDKQITITVTAEDLVTTKKYVITAVTLTPYTRVPVAKGGAITFVNGDKDEVHTWYADTHGSDVEGDLEFLGYSANSGRPDYLPGASGSRVLVLGGGGDGGETFHVEGETLTHTGGGGAGGSVTEKSAFNFASEVSDGKIEVIAGGGGKSAGSKEKDGNSGGDSYFGSIKALGGGGSLYVISGSDLGKGGKRVAGSINGGGSGGIAQLFGGNDGGGGGSGAAGDGGNGTHMAWSEGWATGAPGGGGGAGVTSDISGVQAEYGKGGSGGTASEAGGIWVNNVTGTGGNGASISGKDALGGKVIVRYKWF